MTEQGETPDVAVRERRGVLDRIAAFGDALPDPVFIFIAAIGLVIAGSVAAAAGGWSAVNPVTGARLEVESLLTEANLGRLLVEMPDTLARFPPLGLVLVVMLGAAVAERSGLFSALMGDAVRKLPVRALSPAVFIVGLMSHHAADAAYVVIIPLVALIYAEVGRHPLAGVAIAYAGISGAFAGNIIPGQFDVLILGITEPAARLIDPGFVMNPLGNWWFTLAIGVLFTPIAWFVTDRIVEPRLGAWRASDAASATPGVALETLGEAQRRGLRRAGVAALVVIVLFAALALWPGYTPLIDDDAAGPRRMTPFYRSLIAAFMLLFLASGWAYGAAAGTVRSHRDIVAMMGHGMRDMAPYLVLAFFAAHFVALFSWSNLGPVMAVRGAQALKALDLPHPLLLVCLLLMSSGLDLVVGSASAKWAAMAPVVVPMLMLVGISPEMTTAAYRMGDSIFNVATPLASNFPLVLIICQRWVPKFGVGSMIAMMLPYSLGFMAGGFLLVTAWVGFQLPVGPGAPAAYAPPAAVAPGAP
ncbi:MAG: AbgT family transporter [Phenylobacterium sp.]|uniref:AbgT family transporter n=1 Tax=Phenylobacterium sp. TaxID=1871053 RepID=UPI002732991F|nr:AbgT family transporter [Phenylobacterium sp.]MDP3749840.1 AbgT family transporter [Phenylobacterium sp.]